MKKLSIASLLLMVLLCACGEAAVDSVSNDEESECRYSFFVAGHTYGKPIYGDMPERKPGLYEPFVEKFDRIIEDSTIIMGFLTGDIVQNATVENWEKVEREIDSLGIPIHVAPGNHDIYGDEPFLSRHDSSFRAFTHDGDLFILLNTVESIWQISKRQLKFIEDRVSKYDGSGNVFVFVHHLIWFEPEGRFKEFEPNWWKARPDTVNFYDKVLPLFKGKGQHVYFFAGDAGARPGNELFYYEKGHFTFIASGMGGNKNDNFLVVDVLPNHEIRFEIVDLDSEKKERLEKLEDYQWPSAIDFE